MGHEGGTPEQDVYAAGLFSEASHLCLGTLSKQRQEEAGKRC